MTSSWIDDISRWFADPDNASRLEKVMGYTGCKELWLQAELAMWLEHEKRLAADGPWDTNLLIADYGRCDLGLRNDEGEYELVLEVKVLGGAYQTKVLTGSAGTLKERVAALRASDWVLDPTTIDEPGGFSLLADFRRLHMLEDAWNKVMVLIVDNRSGADSDLGEALANIKLKASASRSVEFATGLHARLWQF